MPICWILNWMVLPPRILYLDLFTKNLMSTKKQFCTVYIRHMDKFSGDFSKIMDLFTLVGGGCCDCTPSPPPRGMRVIVI